MKKILVILLCLLGVFAIISCKNEPKHDDKPTGEPTEQDILSGKAYYLLTATREAKRFALQYSDEAVPDDDYKGIIPKDGDTLTVKYRTDHVVDRIYLRDSSENKYLPEGASYHEIKSEDDPYVSEPDEDGWITFTFEFEDIPEGSGHGFRLEFANYNTGKFKPGQYIEIRDLMFNGERLIIAEDEETQQSLHGVWNNMSATNTDHTLPTLEMKFL